MRNIEQYVTSLEISRRLKELGMPQESCFYWYKSDIQPFETRLGTYDKFGQGQSNCSAYLLEELLEIAKEYGWNIQYFSDDEKVWEVSGRYDSNYLGEAILKALED